MVKLTTSLISFAELEEIVVLLQNASGFDFSGYSKSSLKRRIQRIMDLERMDVVDLKNAIINVESFQGFLINEITVNVTEMFRDPKYYATLVSEVFPYLETYPRLKFWSAGCSTGEEVYSLAILLEEYGLYNRSFIYGTDINSVVLETARKAIYPLKKIKTYSENYIASGAKNSLSDYYTARYDAAIINADIRKNILFSQHNLVSDYTFNEFQFISCRNVLIYFDLELQKKVFDLFYESLSEFGFLCLGSKERLVNHDIISKFKVINKEFNIYQKIK
ncbi:CheR family methyltransferase [Sphingobacterium psychroaquaticum]|uniref:Chemotaxis protein methyltransferase CheR n=1 Tax=Sphingobacterium psychroaquaticum TaxID=561061 RepID=A0A1X7L8F7_9SPHI|nr:protein-glutamate O-methyltransferase CheR [Sphingobacterium psychroaquaticum]QBQ42403.1 protein-glutamate O-methyltransferase CheR [Sphingobacterium psychroaquaticum]SMG50030.1 chemotaxis protein methyltransferase CheR [Sphingobacterium psychroaquaticum]